MRKRIAAGPVLPFRRAEARPYFRMEKKGDTGEIYIYDVIGGDWFGEGTTAKQFQKDLKALGDVKTLDIFINSPGGDVFDGVAIYNQLARHRAKKIVHIDALAASIASVIAMVGDEIEIASNGMMMIHRAWGLAIGNANDMRKLADTLEKVDSTIIGTYVARTGGEEAEITRMTDEETWLTAEEAVELGFADRAAEPVEMAALAKFDLSNFKRVPEKLAEAAKAPAASAASPPSTNAQGENRIQPHAHVVAANERVQAMRARGQIKT